MAIVLFFVILITFLLVLIRKLYSYSSPLIINKEEPGTERLAMLIYPDLMESLLDRAKKENCSPVEMANVILRTALQDFKSPKT